MKIRRGDVALITGASRGIGRHIALALARQGMDLVLAARSQDGLDAVAAEVRGVTDVTVSTLTVDLADRDQAAALAVRAETATGHIDVLVNNAGLEAACRPDQAPLEQLAAMTDVNLLAPMLLTRTILPGMISRGRGHVVNISSMAGLLAMAYQEPYAATKFGLVGYTRALRQSAQDQRWGIGASAICPGFMSGEGMYADMQSEFGVSAPKLAGALPVELVGEAVVKAVDKDLAEVLIMTGAPRAMVVAANAAPQFFERMVRKLDFVAPFRSVASQRTSADKPHG
jgi:short-subunit dehydrogenase